MPTAGHLYDNGPRVKPFLLHEAPGQRSRENGIISNSGAIIASGTVLTKVDAGTAAFALIAGATGNPTSGAIAVGVAAKPGVYRGQFTAATKFDIEDPDGVKVGNGTLGSAFNKGGLTFTLTAGGTAAVAGDEFTITVAEGSGKYIPYTANGAAGEAVAILYEATDTSTGDVKRVVIEVDAEVNRFELTGLDALAEKQLLAKGIKVRGKATLGISTPAL